jgi:hypothetical protein
MLHLGLSRFAARDRGQWSDHCHKFARQIELDREYFSDRGPRLHDAQYCYRRFPGQNLRRIH